MKQTLIVIAATAIIASIVSAAGNKDRGPAQANWPGQSAWPPPSTSNGNGSSTNSPASTPLGSTADDVVTTGTKVTDVSCITNGASPRYSLGTGYSANIRVSRVSSQGDIRYEVYKDNRFIASCAMIQVQSSP